MKKLSITTIASVAVNIILSLWLVQQYFFDQYFHAYVDTALGPVYPFIVLTAGLGGGSTLGYLLLRRRRVGDASGKLEKAKLFKSSGPTPAQGSLSSSQSKVLPTGPPPGQVSRHTAYAVPPLPKSSTSSAGARSSVPSSISVGAKTVTSIPSTSQREQTITPSTSILSSTLRDQFGTEHAPRPSSGVSSAAGTNRGESGPTVNRIPPEPSRMSVPTQWKTEPRQSGNLGPDSTVFPRQFQSESKPGVESPAFGSQMGQVPKPPQPSQSPFPVAKWVPPEQRGEAQWTDPVPKPGLAAPQKWAPPAGPGFGPRPQQAGPPRPGGGPPPGSLGPRPPYPSAQGGPRPLGFPSPPRPGPGPIGAAPPFRSDQPRPGGPSSSPRRPLPAGGPPPQPWNLQKAGEAVGPVQSKESSGPPPLRASQYGATEGPRSPDSKTSDTGSSGGEMDWDTALDTILKTLKKDRGVGEKT
jgi:hypothetical protein